MKEEKNSKKPKQNAKGSKKKKPTKKESGTSKEVATPDYYKSPHYFNKCKLFHFAMMKVAAKYGRVVAENEIDQIKLQAGNQLEKSRATSDGEFDRIKKRTDGLVRKMSDKALKEVNSLTKAHQSFEKLLTAEENREFQGLYNYLQDGVDRMFAAPDRMDILMLMDLYIKGDLNDAMKVVKDTAEKAYEDSLESDKK